MAKYAKLFGRDVDGSDFVFRYFNEDHQRLELKRRFADLACPACGKIDELKALDRGVDPVDFRTNADFFHSLEWLYIVSEKTRVLLDTIAPGEIFFFEVSKNPLLFVSIPKRRLPASEGDPAFQLSRRCAKCNRFLEVVWGPGIPRIPADLTVAAFQLEGRMGIQPGWVASEGIAKSLKRAKLRGLIIDMFEM